MNQKQLEIFLHLSETLNFRKTAEHLYMSQTAVTFQIQNLEEELEAKLFDRNKRSVNLTPAGVTFQQYTSRLLALMNEAANATKTVSDGYDGFLRIGFAIDTNKAGIADLIKEFAESNPGLRLNLQGGYPENLMRELQYDRCDLFVSPYSKSFESKEFRYLSVGHYKQLAAFHKSHRFAQKDSLSFKDFIDEPLICVTNSNIELEFAEEFIEALKARHIQPKILSRTDNIDTVFLMLDANLGVSVIPEYFLERLAASSRIQLCPIDEELNGTDLVAVWKTVNQSAELKKFIDYMMNYFPAD